MAEKNYWEVTRSGIYAVLHCPLCNAWFDIPNAPGNAESYHFCPGCAHPLEVRDEDRYLMEYLCDVRCEYLLQRQEEYDDEPMGWCLACDRTRGQIVGAMDNIRTRDCDCINRSKRLLLNQKGKEE